MNKDEIIKELDEFAKQGHNLRSWKKSDSKADLAALLDETRKSASQALVPAGSDKSDAQQGDQRSESESDSKSEQILPSSVPVHADACTHELDPQGWGAQNPTSKSCADCQKDFPECFAACAEVTALVLAQSERKPAKRKGVAAGGKRNALGHREGSQAAKIDDLLVEGIYTADEIAVLVGTVKTRVRSHIYHLTKVKGCKVTNVGGKYVMPPFTTETTEAAAEDQKAA